MNCAVLGGAGYVGSVISKELISLGYSVDVYDLMLFSDEYGDNNKVIQEDILTSDVKRFSEYDIVIWCCDIDVPIFYTCEESGEYVKSNISRFKQMISEGGDKFYWVTGDSVLHNQNSPYVQMLAEKKGIMIQNKLENNLLVIPELYGPSIRTRLDMFVNFMFVQALTEGMIGVDRWLDRYGINSVGYIGKAIVKHISDKVKKKFPYECVTYSKIEIAHMISKVVSDKVQIITTDTGGGRSHVPEGFVRSDVDAGSFSLERSFKYMLDGIERGLMDNILKDSLYNDKVIGNYVTSRKFSKFMNR